MKHNLMYLIIENMKINIMKKDQLNNNLIIHQNSYFYCFPYLIFINSLTLALNYSFSYNEAFKKFINL